MAEASKRPIVILGPMESESAWLVDQLENRQEKSVGAYTFREGRIDGYPVVICRCYIGVVNSAAATALVIERYDPLCVIIQGTSGAHDPDLHQGDIVLGESIVELGSHYTKHRGKGEGSDMSIVELGSHYTKHRGKGEGSDIFGWTQPGAEMLIEGELRRVSVLHSDSRILSVADNVPYANGIVKRGTIGAADIWNRELDVIAHLRRTLGTDCEEMEGFGVAQVCAQSGVPCADIRVISNSEWHPQEEFNEKYGEQCQMFVLQVIRRLIAEGSLL